MGGESCQAVFVDVDSEWVVAGNIHIDPEIKLAVVDEVRS